MPGDKHVSQSSRCNAVWSLSLQLISKDVACPLSCWKSAKYSGSQLPCGSEPHSELQKNSHLPLAQPHQPDTTPYPLEVQTLNKLGCVGRTWSLVLCFLFLSFPGNSNEIEIPLLPVPLNRAPKSPKFWQGLCCHWVHQEKIQDQWKASPKWQDKP